MMGNIKNNILKSSLYILAMTMQVDAPADDVKATIDDMEGSSCLVD